YMVIGSIMPMIPGVAFTNAIRDIADGDYISGAVRMLDAMLVFFCIAIGMGMGIFLLRSLMGGVPL
ncbi:MAG: threonine/serine exporter family protein, partial [Lachnospiraceae bacterium]|nr:threonine/serine exporter family protein [Lachnospiraceae bacterium]